ncbi:unnamed protein product [Caenorhabditis angaria]|uniref:SKP1 component dimerisation domain-containing protein n=1 Tax=Caenorhabditis angaria TaxID=860376 RepID=A0A9P1I678_9PELO|nr:unnamed protein product [Caenorhabditis angaria]
MNDIQPIICKLRTKEGNIIEVRNPEIVSKIGLIRNYFAMNNSVTVPEIPVQNVIVEDLKFILRHMAKRLNPESEHETNQLDLFNECANLSNTRFLSIIETTNFMEIPDMLQELSKICAHQFQKKTSDEISEYLNIEKDINGIELNEIEKENNWFHVIKEIEE